MASPSPAAKPLPQPTPTSQPFWDGLRRRQIQMQRCQQCRRFVFYPRSNCDQCLSADLQWETIDGRGAVFTYTVARRPTAPQFADEVPQKIAVVELDAGPRLTTTLVNVEPEAITIGMRVKPVFDDIAGTEITLLRYEPE